MLDAAVKALSQMISPPMRSILWRSIGHALVLIIVLAIGLQRLLSWFATYGEVWLEGLLGPGLAFLARGARLDRLDHGGPRRRVRRRVPDACDHLAGGEPVRRRRRRHRRARALSGGAAGRCAAVQPARSTRRQDRAADDPGLSGGVAAGAVRRCRIPDLLRRHRLAARARIFRARRDAVPLAGGGQGDAAATTPPPSSPPACSSRPSSRSRSSIWRRRSSAWRSWSTCTSACRGRGPS